MKLVLKLLSRGPGASIEGKRRRLKLVLKRLSRGPRASIEEKRRRLKPVLKRLSRARKQRRLFTATSSGLHCKECRR